MEKSSDVDDMAAMILREQEIVARENEKTRGTLSKGTSANCRRASLARYKVYKCGLRCRNDAP